MGHFGGRDSGRLSEVVFTQLVKLLDSNNALVKLFRTARDKCAGSKVPTFKVCLYSVSVSSQQALPTSDAIGAIVFESGPQSISDYDVIIEPRSQLPRRVNKLHPLYMSIQFPLMFFFGEPGFHPDLKLCAASGSQGARALELQSDFETGSSISEVCGDGILQHRADRMDYIRNKQNDIRAEYLSGLYDAIDRGDKTGSDVGSMTILLASFTGGPRYIYSHYLDALAISRVFGNPAFFVTFTCNAKWPEISRYLKPFPHPSPSDRADIVARVFHMKVNEFINFLKDERPLGHFCIRLNFRKEGCHIATLWFEGNQNFSCSKKFPKKYIDKTYFDDNGRAHYRRRNTGIYTTRAGVHLDNSYVVPYNRLLCMTFQAHINVECCGTTSLIKYLFKCSVHLSSRSLLADFNFLIHHREPAVKILAVHLENMQLVKFLGKQPLRAIVENNEAKKTTLTEWLNYNASSVNGSHLTYLDFPTEFVWYESKKVGSAGQT
ncbi:uncharacterized protein [Rutidosis leptorrhynchoides]|uniref:uncharacterized protein n=1 Tax=Rutidosis leptorrhynchoides TaxID=125765 RepID=UPI003A99583E